MKLPHRRNFLHLAAGAAALPAVSRVARAQSYPARPVRLIVPIAAGGTQDILARLVGQWQSERLGQPLVVDNRPGGGGNIGTEAVVRAPADGYTLLLIATPHAVNATLDNQVNVMRDIAPIAGIGGEPFVMLVNPSLPAKTLPEFIAHARANPGKLNMTSSGTGNLSHLSGEMFRMMTGIDMVHVPYKGTVAALSGLVSGEVHVMFDSLPSALPHIQEGKLRALAVTSASRATSEPNLPTVGEFVTGYEMMGIMGVGAPKNTPAAIIDKLNRDINAVVADPELKDRLVGLNSIALAGTPAEFGTLIREQAEKWARVLKFAGVTAR